MSSSQVLFLALAIPSALFALGVVLNANPVRAALCLVGNFLLLGIIYFTLGAQLLGITQIMVYAGAIMVLFLFVIMVLKLRQAKDDEPQRDVKVFVAGLLGVSVFMVVFSQIIFPLSHFPSRMAPANWGTPQTIGSVMYTQFAWPLLVASVLLLVGVVGSILLAKRRL